MNVVKIVSGCLISLGLWGCKSPDPPLQIIQPDSQLAPQASVVSVQATSAATARLVLKINGQLTAGWQLSGAAVTGQALTIIRNTENSVGLFTLITHTVSGLVADQSYSFQLRFKFDNRDSVTVIRRYVHRLNAQNWTELAHAPLDGGDFTAYPVSVDPARQGDYVTLGRYASSTKMQGMVYRREVNQWTEDQFAPVRALTPRRGVIQYVLYFQGIDQYFFSGLGYQITEQGSEQIFYNRDLFVATPGGRSVVFPQYQGENGEVAFFTVGEVAYFLTQNGSSAMRSIGILSDQINRAPLPEPPGILATFTLGNLGYVVNQRPDQPVHLWAYDPKADAWQRRADFPGAVRSRGAAFSVAGKGYFGLGVDSEQRGLRDIWQYDPISNGWQYVTDYPGQGNRYLAVLSAPSRAYVGWGYESQLTSTGAVRQVPCTDWWEFKL